ncbi:MAG: aerotaxis transducer Aer2, partial [Pseudomonadota bacterium]
MSRLGDSWFGSLFGKWGHGEALEQLRSRVAALESEMIQAAEEKAKVSALDKSLAVIEFSLDGRILDANENFLRTVGYSLDEIRGQHHSLFVDPTYRDSLEYRQFWQKLGRGDFDAGQYRRIGRGGREIWLEATYNPVFDVAGRPCKVIKFATDITAQIHTNQALQRAVSETQGVVAAAQSGDLRPRIPLEGKSGPIRELCEGINHMLDGIVTAQERERAVASENARIRIALDNVSAAVMIADNDLNIIYANGAANALFRAAEADIRREISEFDAHAMIGTQMDLFSRTGDRNAALLKNLRGAHQAEVVVGGRTLAWVASPVLTVGGERLGTVVQWRDRSEEVRTESDVAKVIHAAAEGDLGQRVNVSGMQGFVRVLGEGINQLLDTSQAGLQEIVRVQGALSRGELDDRITNDYAGTFGELKDSANDTVARLTDIVGQIKQAASAISTATHEIAAGNSDLSRRTEEQAASLEQTASNMDELTSTVKQNADNAKQANKLAIGASDVAVRGGQVVAEVVGTMKSISESAKRIAEIISVIDGIAFQTN